MSTSADWAILRVNATFAEFVGIDADELVGLSFQQLLAAGSRIYLETHYAPLLRLQGRIEEVAADLERADGPPLPVLMASVLLPGDADRPDVVRTSVMAAPQRRRFEAEVQRARRSAETSEDRARVLHEVVAALATSVDVGEVVTAVEERLGDQEVDRTGVWVSLDSDTLARLSRTGGVGRTTVSATSDSAIARAWRTAELVVEPALGWVVVPLGLVAGATGVLVIALERVIGEVGAVDEAGPGTGLDGEDRDLLATLGREVGQALERARLYERKDWLLGMAAHDLRTPLTVMIGNAHTVLRMLDDSLTDQDRTLLERIVAVGDGMTDLIDDVLEMSSIEAGTLSVELRATDLQGLVADAVEALEATAEAKDISLAVDEPRGLDLVMLDPERMRQVLDNLLSNAIKYSEAGSDVQVRLFESADAVGVEVEDHGVGIAEDELGQVFQPFRRTSSQPTGGESSTGLGLSIARSIVEAHGGRIGVTSRLGEGTTFRVSLPRDGAEQAGS